MTGSSTEQTIWVATQRDIECDNDDPTAAFTDEEDAAKYAAAICGEYTALRLYDKGESPKLVMVYRCAAVVQLPGGSIGDVAPHSSSRTYDLAKLPPETMPCKASVNQRWVGTHLELSFSATGTDLEAVERSVCERYEKAIREMVRFPAVRRGA
jgi:hypothetical protein